MTHEASATLDPTLLRALPNAATPVAGVVTAGQPSAAQLEALAQAGLRTVVDLRASAEPRGFDEAERVRAAGMTYHPVPVTPTTLGADEFEAVRELLRARDTRPTLVHCASGNRVGALLIPYLVLDDGRSPDEALAIAHEVGLRSDDLARVAFDYVRTRGDGR